MSFLWGRDSFKSILFMKKIIAIVLSCILLGVAIIFFLWENAQKSKKGLYQDPISIGVVDFPGYAALFLANEKGYFKEAGLNVTLKKFTSLTDQSQAFSDNSIQGSAVNVFDAVLYSYSDIDQKIVLVIDYSSGVDAVVGVNTIKNASDLKGKKIAYEVGTLEEFFLASLLKRESLSLADIITVDANPEEAVLKLKNGEAEAAVTYEPFVSLANSIPNVRTISSSAEFPGVISDVLTFKTDFVNQHPLTVSKILEAYFKAQNYVASYPDEAVQILAKGMNITVAEAAAQMRGVKILDSKTNKEILGTGFNEHSYYLNLEKINKFISLNKKHNSLRLNTDKIVDSSFIRELAY